jgi:hypothetical protein
LNRNSYKLQRAAYDASTVPVGQYRKVVEVDGNGMKMVKWIGQRSFTDDFKAPVRRVISFLLPQGPVDASGRFLR